MGETVEIPVALLSRMAEASEAMRELEEELEDYLISQDTELLSRLERARQQQRGGVMRPFAELTGAVLATPEFESDYRLLFWPDHEREEVVLYAIAHRREIYRRLGRA